MIAGEALLDCDEAVEREWVDGYYSLMVFTELLSVADVGNQVSRAFTTDELNKSRIGSNLFIRLDIHRTRNRHHQLIERATCCAQH